MSSVRVGLPNAEWRSILAPTVSARAYAGTLLSLGYRNIPLQYEDLSTYVEIDVARRFSGHGFKGPQILRNV